MYAVGVYDMRGGTLCALEENYETITSNSAYLEALFTPLYELHGKLSRKEVPDHVVHDQFEQIRDYLFNETWYLEGDYGWEQFARGDMPEIAVESDEQGWVIYLDDYTGVDGYQEGDENDPFQVINRSKATFIAVFFYHEFGYLYVLRSPHVVGGTILDQVHKPAEIADRVMADPLRPGGGVPTYALPLKASEDANQYNAHDDAEDEE